MKGSNMIARSFRWSARRNVGQVRVGEGEVALIGVARGHREGDAPHAGAYQRADLEEFEADGAAGGFGELGVLRARRRNAHSST